MNFDKVNKQLPVKVERHKLFGSVPPRVKNKPTEKEKMADLQNQSKDFMFRLDTVGVSNVKHPIKINSKTTPENQTSIGEFTFTTGLGVTKKGTNMSRFTEKLNQQYKQGFPVDLYTMKQFASELKQRLEQNDATIEVSFPWFFERKAPDTNLSGLNHAHAFLSVTNTDNNTFNIKAKLEGKVTTLCPCSKEISEYSAHNQRGNITMEIEFTEGFNETETDWKQQLLEAAESNASARLYPVLKRPDEKAVTEIAYENPRFVEDIVRLVAADLYEMPFVSKFKVTCRNEESIHLHDAIASVTFDKTTESND